MWNKVQKRVCGTASPSIAAPLEPLAHRGNVARLSLFYRYYFGWYLSELVRLPSPRGASSRCQKTLYDFSITIPRFYKDVCV